MGTHEYGIRDLRNHTSTVLHAVGQGDTVYLTNRGVRVALISPIEEKRPIDRLIAKAAQTSPGDTGALDELLAAREADIAAQSERESALWG